MLPHITGQWQTVMPAWPPCPWQHAAIWSLVMCCDGMCIGACVAAAPDPGCIGINTPEAIAGAAVNTSARHANAAMIRRPRERRQRCRDRSMGGTYPARDGFATLESGPCAAATPNARSHKPHTCRRAGYDRSPQLNARYFWRMQSPSPCCVCPPDAA
jgi:hypothetical protein